MKWIKAIDRLPELPNPLPPNTEDERGVLFVNRTHSCAHLWFPSYGYDSKPHVTEDGHWNLSQWEWLDETTPVNNDAVEVSKHNEDANVYIDRAIAMLKEEYKGECLIAGYNGIVSLLGYAKESHAASKHQPVEDWISFTEWVGDNYVKLHGGWVLKYESQIHPNLKTTQQVKEKWEGVKKLANQKP